MPSEKFSERYREFSSTDRPGWCNGCKKDLRKATRIIVDYGVEPHKRYCQDCDPRKVAKDAGAQLSKQKEPPKEPAKEPPKEPANEPQKEASKQNEPLKETYAVVKVAPDRAYAKLSLSNEYGRIHLEGGDYSRDGEDLDKLLRRVRESVRKAYDEIRQGEGQ